MNKLARMTIWMLEMIGAAFAFGCWQESFWAGAWMFCVFNLGYGYAAGTFKTQAATP